MAGKVQGTLDDGGAGCLRFAWEGHFPSFLFSPVIHVTVEFAFRTKFFGNFYESYLTG
jgi:hypothetical protein